MKRTIVIHTQYMENYGTNLNPYMKFKGGHSYLIHTLNPDISENEIATIVAQVRPLITCSMLDTNGGCEEYINDYKLLANWKHGVEDYDNPTELWFDDKPGGGEWKAMCVTDNRDFMGLKMQILERTETWTCGPAQQRNDYKTSFLMEDGDIVDGQDGLAEWFNAQEAA